ncbi:MAG: phosphate starvation-inducible protein PhoH [Thiotrichales bacterium]|nr:phosphate starvation-inducible protein PhoH [Thiotrichales bacterium]
MSLEPVDNQRLANLCGAFDQHLRQLERRLGVEVNNRGNAFRVLGEPDAARAAAEVLRELYALTAEDALTPARVHLYLQEAAIEESLDEKRVEETALKLRRGVIRGRGVNQSRYIRNIQTHDINFGIGPAGTGKTYLAVACAVSAFENDEIRRIVLVRPAVEAGERLGFLPGDLAQKVDPYLRPLYDALYEMLGFERVGKLIERSVIEIAPLAYMRGRTLNESFIILDEAQNTTVEQMKMFLTRIGFGSTAVINGDVTQIDLPSGKQSGLRQVTGVLKSVDGISFNFFKSKDVVRHPLVAKILDAYEAHEHEQPGDGRG